MSGVKGQSKPIDISEFLPDKETEAAFKKWGKDNFKRIEAFEKSEAKSLLWALSEFWYETVNKAWIETLDLVQQQGDLLKRMNAAIPEAHKQGETIAMLSHWDAIRQKEARLLNLAKGRRVAIEVRQKRAKENHAMLDKAISDLFAKPDSKGWRWTNGDIADFVAERFPAYTPGTILQRVKKLAAKHRKENAD